MPYKIKFLEKQKEQFIKEKNVERVCGWRHDINWQSGFLYLGDES